MPENLTDMKRSKKEKGDDCPEVSCDSQEDYPYGLRIHLEDDEISKLNIPMPEIGSTMVLVANIKVTSVSERADEDGENRSVGLQITEMELAPYEKNETDHVKKLYSE